MDFSLLRAHLLLLVHICPCTIALQIFKPKGLGFHPWGALNCNYWRSSLVRVQKLSVQLLSLSATAFKLADVACMSVISLRASLLSLGFSLWGCSYGHSSTVPSNTFCILYSFFIVFHWRFGLQLAYLPLLVGVGVGVDLLCQVLLLLMINQHTHLFIP